MGYASYSTASKPVQYFSLKLRYHHHESILTGHRDPTYLLGSLLDLV